MLTIKTYLIGAGITVFLMILMHYLDYRKETKNGRSFELKLGDMIGLVVIGVTSWIGVVFMIIMFIGTWLSLLHIKKVILKLPPGKRLIKPRYTEEEVRELVFKAMTITSVHHIQSRPFYKEEWWEINKKK